MRIVNFSTHSSKINVFFELRDIKARKRTFSNQYFFPDSSKGCRFYHTGNTAFKGEKSLMLL